MKLQQIGLEKSMDKKLNTLFFGSCFLAAFLGEAYCLLILKEPISIIALGIVVVITAYLFMDSIRSKVVKGIENLKFLVDKVHQEESEKWNDRYAQILNIQKATYGTIKKQNTLLNEQVERLQTKLIDLENHHAKALQVISELQLKALEGQKNALNLNINYNRENTKQLINHFRENTNLLINHSNDNMNQLIKVLQEEGNKIESSLKIEQIVVVLNKLNESMDKLSEQTLNLLNQSNTSQESTAGKDLSEYREASINGFANENNVIENNEKSDVIENNIIMEDKVEDNLEDNTEQEDIGSDTITQDPVVVPIYDDPNKKLTPEEIAALFASVSNN